MLIAANKAVSIDYTLTNDAGEVIDSSAGGAPLVYLHGAGNIIPGRKRPSRASRAVTRSRFPSSRRTLTASTARSWSLR